MKKTRVIAVLLAVVMVIAAVSCNEEQVHEHSFGEGWQKDAANH